MLPAHFR
ncbi:hypothetical protein D043_3294A, partial [Vibrio parahaemolyticus EKP-021]